MRLRTPVSAPRVAGVVACGIALGGFSACYPGALLAEPKPPGLVAGILLGAAGVLLLAPLWLAAVAAGVTAPQGVSGLRATMFAAGLSQPRLRFLDSRQLGRIVVIAGAAGAGGGLLATVAESTRRGEWSAPMHLAPSPTALVLGLICVGASVFVGGMLGIAAGSAALAVTIVYVGLVASLLLTGAAYFASALQPIASAMPGSIFLVLGQSHVASPQFTSTTSRSTAWITTIAWLCLGLAFARRRMRREVR